MNACIDALSVYRTSVANQPQSSGLLAPYSLRLLPLFILAIMKHVGVILSECCCSIGYNVPLLRWAYLLPSARIIICPGSRKKGANDQVWTVTFTLYLLGTGLIFNMRLRVLRMRSAKLFFKQTKESRKRFEPHPPPPPAKTRYA